MTGLWVDIPRAGHGPHLARRPRTGLRHAFQPLTQLAEPPREPVRGDTGPFVRLPGRVACLAGPGAFLPGGVKGGLGADEVVAGRVEGRLGALHRGLGFGQSVLSRGQLATQAGELLDCLTAGTCRVRHLTIIAGSRRSAEPGTQWRHGAGTRRRPVGYPSMSPSAPGAGRPSSR